MILAGLATAVACATVCTAPTNTETMIGVYGEQALHRGQETAPTTSEEPHSHSHGTASVWDRLAKCESHGEWDYGPHSGWGSGIYHGGLQFHPNTWANYRPADYPDKAYQASREQQISVAERVLEEQGWQAWPACSRKLGLR